MCKRILYILCTLSFAFAPVAHAVVVAPYFNITIIKQSVGADGTFNFRLGAFPPYNNYSQAFQIQTQQGAGSFFMGITSGSGTIFTITEDSVPGWHSGGISCASDNPSITTSVKDGGVDIVAYPFSSIICTFINTQALGLTPVLIIPGVLGTDMVKGADKLWLNLSGMSTDVGDDFMDPLLFGNNLLPIDFSVKGTDMLRKKTFGPFTYDYGAGLIQEFTNQGYIENQDLFTFPYDWRYGASGKDSGGIAVNVEALKQKIQAIRDQTGSDKVDVVAHSTGGLLVKKYVQDHTQDHHIGKAVFVGVPNAGAPKAIKVLLSGDNFGIPWLADGEMKKIGQNLPVLYDLAPSRTYVNRKGSFLRTIDQKFLAKDVVADLNYDAAWDLMVHGRGANQAGLTNAEAVHSSSFDDYDLRTAGVDMYNIVGCKTGTLGQIVERRTSALFGDSNISYDTPVETPGDGTVPLESATNVPVDVSHKYYSLKAEHGKMMSQDGVRQQIVNIVAGSSLSTPHMTQDIDQCKLKGKAHAIFSPVDIEVLDQLGNQLGVAVDGSLQNDIPGADFSKFGDHKFVYLPDDEGQIYDIHLKGTDSGVFTYKVQDIQNNSVTQTEVFPGLPVTTSLVGGVTTSGGHTVLTLDTNGDGITDRVLSPTAILGQSQSQDQVSPVTTPAITGTQGVPGYYRSNVGFNLSAVDYAQSDAAPAGLLDTKYSIDGAAYDAYNVPISINTEGSHSVKFYSTDRAGNSEAEQELKFTIDKTAPEAVFGFSAQVKDMIVTAQDALDPNPTVADGGDVVRITDKAGNVTVVGLSEKDRKKKLKAELVSLSYNGALQDISNNKFSYKWEYDKNANLKKLEQQAKSKKDFNVSADYNGAVTKVEGKDATGKIKQTYPALKLLQIKTYKGDLDWSLF